MDEEWEAADPLPPGDEFPVHVPRRQEMESQGAEEADHGDYAVQFPTKFIQLLSPPEKNVRSLFMILIRACATRYDICVLF